MPTPLQLLTRGSWSEAQRFSEILRKETVGGVLLLAAAGAALVGANSPWPSTYRAISEIAFGPESLHLRLSLSACAADCLLAIFF
jgi:Na+:H+ antiporter, NhaA family